ncbi:MAG: GNAT family N-acetyltransferase [Promethearchaeota archaeon]|nr:MAG: GNAT family N-acetyltransferase [Candidatus Lokiarchaeota archaeon]
MIEKVSLRDLNEIYRIEKKTFKSDSFSRKLLQSLIQSNSLFFKLVSPKGSKKLIGYVILIKDDEYRFNLINFLIKKKYQSKGYGSLLLKKTLSIVKKIPRINKVILNVRITNLKAINLYNKFGFEIIGKIANYYRDNESAYLMELKI